MSANDVLQQVMALPAPERRKFFECIHDLEPAIRRRPCDPYNPKVKTRRRKLIEGLNARLAPKTADAEAALEKAIDEMYPETKHVD